MSLSLQKPYALKSVAISRRSRVIVKLLKWGLKPLIRLFAGVSSFRLIRNQIRLAGQLKPVVDGLSVDYHRYTNGVPGPIMGDFSHTQKTLVLYLHGGGFMIPAVPLTHLEFLGDVCVDLDAVGYMPDYRLAPMHRFPAALDDCERAYRGVLEAGFAPERIVLMGESAGANLCLGLLQHIRRHGLPQPACAIPISAVTELARVHAPLSRVLNFRRDPLLPLHAFTNLAHHYIGDADATNPELSPIYADCTDFPPLFFLVGDTEILLDDTLIMADHARAAGVDCRVDVWPVMPHAFPLFTRILPEAAQARRDIVDFARSQLR